MSTRRPIEFLMCAVAICWVAVGQPASSAEPDEKEMLRRIERVSRAAEIKGRASQLLEIARKACELEMSRVVHMAVGAALKSQEAGDAKEVLDCAETSRCVRAALVSHADLARVSLRDCRQLVNLLSGIASEDEEPQNDLQLRAVRAIDGLASDRSLKREALLPTVSKGQAGRAAYAAASILAPLASSNDIAALREFAIDAVKRGSFSPAAEIVAYHGDKTLLPLLEGALEDESKVRGAVRARFSRAIWRIKAQHPPDSLLDSIKSLENGIDRPWAIERAIALGVSREKIRDAILDYTRRQQDPRDRMWRAERKEIVRISRESGVLTEDDVKGLPPAEEISTTPETGR